MLRGESLLGEERAPEGRHAAEALLPCVDALLRRHQIGIGDIDAYAVSVGPGSFTGLRIGIATLKGLAFGSGCPVAPVPTLAALARSAGQEPEPVVATLDARRGELYAGAWTDRGTRPHPVLPEGVYRPEELDTRLPSGCTVLAGAEVRAADVGALGVDLLARGRGVEAANLQPRYVRRAEAEVKRTGLRFEDGPAGGGL